MQYCNIILLVIVVKTVCGDHTCLRDDFVGANQCINQTIHKAFDKTVMDEAKVKIEKCFEEIDCHSDNKPSHSDSALTFGIGTIKGKSAADYKNCFLKVVKSATVVIESCVRKTFPDFVAPNVDDYQDMMSNDRAEFMEKIKSAFTNCKSDQLLSLITCMKTVAEQSGMGQADMEKACRNLNSCTDSLPCGFENVKAATCSCAKEHLNTKTGSVNPFEDEFFACMGQSPPSNTRRRSLAPFVNKAVEQICRANPCNSSDKQ